MFEVGCAYTGHDLELRCATSSIVGAYAKNADRDDEKAAGKTRKDKGGRGEP